MDKSFKFVDDSCIKPLLKELYWNLGHFLVEYIPVSRRNFYLYFSNLDVLYFTTLRTFLCFIWLLISTSLQGQVGNRFERLSTASGLSQSSVYKIIQDKKGFLWFATADGLKPTATFGGRSATKDKNQRLPHQTQFHSLSTSLR